MELSSGIEGESGEKLCGVRKRSGAEFFLDRFEPAVEKVLKTLLDKEVGGRGSFSDRLELEKEALLEISCEKAGRVESLEGFENGKRGWGKLFEKKAAVVEEVEEGKGKGALFFAGKCLVDLVEDMIAKRVEGGKVVIGREREGAGGWSDFFEERVDLDFLADSLRKFELGHLEHFDRLAKRVAHREALTGVEV